MEKERKSETRNAKRGLIEGRRERVDIPSLCRLGNMSKISQILF